MILTRLEEGLGREGIRVRYRVARHSKRAGGGDGRRQRWRSEHRRWERMHRRQRRRRSRNRRRRGELRRYRRARRRRRPNGWCRFRKGKTR